MDFCGINQNSPKYEEKKERGKSPKSPIKNKRWDKIKSVISKILNAAVKEAVKEAWKVFIKFILQMVFQSLF